MIGPDKQHSQWLVSYSPSKECTLWVPCHLNSRTSATQAPSATNICETSSSVNICRRNRTLFDNYSVLSFDNISHCRPSDATCHVFTFSPFTLLELEIFSWGNVNHPFLSMTTHSLLRTVLHCSQCHHWQHLDCHHLLLFDYGVWDRWVSGLQPLIGFALPWPRWSPPHQQTHPYLLSQPYFFSHTSLYLLYVVFLVAHSKKSCKVVKYPDQISMCLTEQ